MAVCNDEAKQGPSHLSMDYSEYADALQESKNTVAVWKIVRRAYYDKQRILPEAWNVDAIFNSIERHERMNEPWSTLSF